MYRRNIDNRGSLLRRLQRRYSLRSVQSEEPLLRQTAELNLGLCWVYVSSNIVFNFQFKDFEWFCWKRTSCSMAGFIMSSIYQYIYILSRENKAVLLILPIFTKTFQGLFNFVKLVESGIYL